MARAAHDDLALHEMRPASKTLISWLASTWHPPSVETELHRERRELPIVAAPLSFSELRYSSMKQAPIQNRVALRSRVESEFEGNVVCRTAVYLRENAGAVTEAVTCWRYVHRPCAADVVCGLRGRPTARWRRPRPDK
jgi:hypothetical protein